MKFDNLSGTAAFLLVFGSGALLLVGWLAPNDLVPSDLAKAFVVAGTLGQCFYFLRPFLYRNYLQWNKGGFNLKVNQVFGSTFYAFADVHSVSLDGSHMSIQQSGYPEPTVYNLSHLQPEDRNKLLGILQSYLTPTSSC